MCKQKFITTLKQIKECNLWTRCQGKDRSTKDYYSIIRGHVPWLEIKVFHVGLFYLRETKPPISKVLALQELLVQSYLRFLSERASEHELSLPMQLNYALNLCRYVRFSFSSSSFFLVFAKLIVPEDEQYSKLSNFQGFSLVFLVSLRSRPTKVLKKKVH